MRWTTPSRDVSMGVATCAPTSIRLQGEKEHAVPSVHGERKGSGGGGDDGGHDVPRLHLGQHDNERVGRARVEAMLAREAQRRVQLVNIAERGKDEIILASPLCTGGKRKGKRPWKVSVSDATCAARCARNIAAKASLATASRAFLPIFKAREGRRRALARVHEQTSPLKSMEVPLSPVRVYSLSRSWPSVSSRAAARLARSSRLELAARAGAAVAKRETAGRPTRREAIESMAILRRKCREHRRNLENLASGFHSAVGMETKSASALPTTTSSSSGSLRPDNLALHNAALGSDSGDAGRRSARMRSARSALSSTSAATSATGVTAQSSAAHLLGRDSPVLASVNGYACGDKVATPDCAAAASAAGRRAFGSMFAVETVLTTLRGVDYPNPLVQIVHCALVEAQAAHELCRPPIPRTVRLRCGACCALRRVSACRGRD